MQINDSGVYQVNPRFIRPAKIIKVNADETADIMVFTHPGDYPEFSQAECASGNGFRSKVKEGPNNNQFQPRR